MRMCKYNRNIYIFDPRQVLYYLLHYVYQFLDLHVFSTLMVTSRLYNLLAESTFSVLFSDGQTQFQVTINSDNLASSPKKYYVKFARLIIILSHAIEVGSPTFHLICSLQVGPTSSANLGWYDPASPCNVRYECYRIWNKSHRICQTVWLDSEWIAPTHSSWILEPLLLGSALYHEYLKS